MVVLVLMQGCSAESTGDPPPLPPSELFVGSGYACLLTDGVATCQFLDDEELDDGQTRTPEQGWRTLELGYATTCGIRTDGTARCWGWNGSGQAEVPEGTWSSLSVAYEHACGIHADGTLGCWGANYGGETTAPAGTFVDVATFASDTLVLDSAGRLTWWGVAKSSGVMTEPPDIALRDVDGFTEVACALDPAGALYCWGSPAYPITPPGGDGYSGLTVGAHHACALDTAREAVCWGDDATGQVSGVPEGTWRSIAAGRFMTCGLRDDYAVECWGCAGEGDAYCHWGTPVTAPPDPV
jgi:alpha-tubulin suppressor-like RCC1 family protein